MDKLKIVPQIEFKTLDSFIKGQNNFFHFFIENSDLGQVYRDKVEAYARFKEKNPNFVRELTQRITSTPKEDSQFPWNDLYGAYQSMAKLVHEDDGRVKRNDGSFDNRKLCR